MQVEILLFAALKDELGASRTLDVSESRPGETTVGEVRQALLAECPSAGRLGRRILVAVNEAYAGDGDPIRPGDTIAFLPPVSGG